jgi:hypothetical protein
VRPVVTVTLIALLVLILGAGVIQLFVLAR